MGIALECLLIVTSFLDRDLKQWARLRAVCRQWRVAGLSPQWVSLLQPCVRLRLPLALFQLLSRLQYLRLSDLLLPDLSLFDVGRLRELHLVRCVFPWNWDWTSVTSLHKLRLDYCVITDENLEGWTALSSLQVLELSLPYHGFPSIEGVQVLKSLTMLQELSISGDWMADERFCELCEVLPSLSFLTSLTIRPEYFLNSTILFQAIYNLTQLKSLGVAEFFRDGAPTVILAQRVQDLRCMKLEKLSLEHVDCNSGVLENLSVLTSLRTLELRSCYVFASSIKKVLGFVQHLALIECSGELKGLSEYIQEEDDRDW